LAAITKIMRGLAKSNPNTGSNTVRHRAQGSHCWRSGGPLAADFGMSRKTRDHRSSRTYPIEQYTGLTFAILRGPPTRGGSPVPPPMAKHWKIDCANITERHALAGPGASLKSG